MRGRVRVEQYRCELRRRERERYTKSRERDIYTKLRERERYTKN